MGCLDEGFTDTAHGVNCAGYGPDYGAGDEIRIRGVEQGCNSG
jgi:hypothetical protein